MKLCIFKGWKNPLSRIKEEATCYTTQKIIATNRLTSFFINQGPKILTGGIGRSLLDLGLLYDP